MASKLDTAVNAIYRHPRLRSMVQVRPERREDEDVLGGKKQRGEAEGR